MRHEWTSDEEEGLERAVELSLKALDHQFRYRAGTWRMSDGDVDAYAREILRLAEKNQRRLGLLDRVLEWMECEHPADESNAQMRLRNEIRHELDGA